jgi:hypothetical protein
MAIADENFINGLFRTYSSVNRFYSLKDFMKTDSRFAQFTALMSTATLGMAIPSFKEEYEEPKPFDLVGTLSHEFFSDKITDAT